MTDDEFLGSLEACELPEQAFGHRAHVRAAYLYLRKFDFPDSLARIRRTLRNYAAHLGKPGRYHETITLAYLALIQQHIDERGPGSGWDSFEKNNPELLQRDLLSKYYSRAELDSELARRVFVLPGAWDACPQNTAENPSESRAG